ncbi:unnamed protein product [Calypogeia fissa]
MLGVARFFWRRFVKQARQFLELISESHPKQYCSGAEIVNRIEALFLLHTLKGKIEESFLQTLRLEYIASLFFDENGKVLLIEDALRTVPSSLYDLPSSRYLSRFLIREVVMRGMYHAQVIK